MKKCLVFLFLIVVLTVLSLTGCGTPNDSTNLTVVTIAAIEGVTPPVTGETPVTAITATEQYTGTVAWSDSPVVFAAGTRYTATITLAATLSAKGGYTMMGVAKNFFTVAGSFLHGNNPNSGVVIAVFPATGADSGFNATPVITNWPTASTISYGAPLSSSALTGGTASVPGFFAWTDGAIIPAVTNSGYQVIFVPNNTVVFNTVTKDDLAVTVNKATLIVAADDFDIAHNAPVPDYTYTVSNFHHGENTSVLSGWPNITCDYYYGAPSGSYPVIITQGTLAAANYDFDFIDGTVSVGLITQAGLSIINPGAKTYGDAAFSLSASGGSGAGTVHFEITPSGVSSDVINLTSEGQVTIIGAGTVTVKAVKAGDAIYNHAESAPITITVGKRNLNNAVVSVPGTYTYTGSAHAPAPTVTDIINSVNRINPADYAVSHSSNTNAGTATVTITATANGNYTGSKTANFTINKATLTVTANDHDIAIGAPAPAYTHTVSGFLLGENQSVLTGAPDISCAYIQGDPSGSYAVTITQGTLNAANYTFSFVNGTVSVGLTH